MRPLLLLLTGVTAFPQEPPPAREVIAAEIPKEETGWEGDHATGNWGGLRDRLVDRGLHLYAGYAAEVLGNVSGGMERGAVYDGLLEMSVELQTGSANLWEGGTFRISSLYPHGSSVSQKYSGDLLAASNIDAYDSIRLYECWYEHELLGERLSTRAGLLAADDEFVFTESGGNFLNSAFGWPAFVSGNVVNTGPAYFVTGLGLRVRYEPSDAWFIHGGVFDGDTFDSPDGDPRVNASGTHLRLSGEQGIFAIGEAGYRINPNPQAGGLPGVYKAGVWTHTADFDSHREDENGGEIARSGLSPKSYSHNYGFYLSTEQMVWSEEGEQGLWLFARAGVAPRDRSLFEFVSDFGCVWRGLIPTRDDDALGVGFVHARISRDIQRFESLDADVNGTVYPAYSDHESVLECFYSMQVNKWWTVQPDLQWIFHPGGSTEVSDAVVVGLRTIFVF